MELTTVFQNYAKSFLCGRADFDGNIELKRTHSFRVMSLAAKIARAEKADENDFRLAVTAGLLHDYGRFEQYRQFETFAVLQNNMRELAEKYGAGLYAQIGNRMFPELAERYQEERDKEAEKITDPAMIDPADLPRRIASRGDRPVKEPEQIKMELPGVLYDPNVPEKSY